VVLRGVAGPLPPMRHLGDLGQRAPQPDVGIAGAPGSGVGRRSRQCRNTSWPPDSAARCSALGKHDRSVPISATSTSAVRRPTPGDGLEQRGRVPLGVGGQTRFQLSVQTRDGRVQVVQRGKLLTRAAKPWWASRRPTTACASASRLARSFPRANSAKAWLCACPLSQAL
jgi:hypothetical protein